MITLSRLSFALLALTILLPVDAAAQARPQTRQGFWFNIGLGYGTLGCDGCGDRTGAASGGLALGGTVSPRVLLGAGSNGWTKTESGATLSVATLTGMIRVYPMPASGFFILGGLGFGAIQGSLTGFGFTVSATETGVGGLLGVGYDFRVGQNVSITPYFNGFGTNTATADANIVQIGVGVTLH